MEKIFTEIMERIASQMPQLSLIDEDYGQLQTDEDTYPVTFPCVLIGNINTDWNNVGGNVQKGASTIVIKLAVDCYHDTSYGSGTAHHISERLAMNQKLYLALQGFLKDRRAVSSLVRTNSVNYSLPGGIKVYQTTFKFSVHDESAFGI